MHLLPVHEHMLVLLVSFNIFTLCHGEGLFHYSYPDDDSFNASIEADGETWYFQTDSSASFINVEFILIHENGSTSNMSIQATEYWAGVLHTVDLKVVNGTPTCIASWKSSQVLSCCENYSFSSFHVVNDGNIIWSKDHDAISALRLTFKDNIVSLYVMMGVCSILVIMVLVLMVILIKWTGETEQKTRRTSTIIPYTATSF
ncbi:unnamed protein product [Meganyctiphanes norvegica]|uniref:Uncharacterized protein n=1 Tax=Meganyctiphanes norvegica TaxID=48144 RepID=A0AAV2S1H3_MEGNR